jgi:peptide-methionine (S)-S-oxide reductase
MDRQSIVVGGGCFWCIEAVYRRVDGVLDAESGYAGGSTADPSYHEVCSGTTGHAEVVRITFDADTISLAEILDLFWNAHDPTTLNRQGADVGPQYRSIILYGDERQKNAAEESRAAAGSRFPAPIVTEISPLREFYLAEEVHQRYYENNTRQGYCRIVIEPKLRKLGFDSEPRR